MAGSECDSTTLLDSRSASLSPAEPNQPNTLDTCTDSTSGTYDSDESKDRIVVRRLDGLDFVEGATVEVEATVWTWNTGSADTLDLYYAADASNPSWTLITSIGPSSGGQNVLTAQYTLPTGSIQAVRANFRYRGSQSSCSGGSYDDAGDDASDDFFRLEYSTNSGSSWSTLASNGDSTSNASWAEATATIPAGSNVQLRVQCSDGAGPGDLVECGIDDVSICE